MVASSSRPPVAQGDCIPPASFAHVVIRTAQMDLMTEWYKIVLGTHVVFRNDIVCFLTYDHEHHRIALLNSSADSREGNCRIDHIAYAYESGRFAGELLPPEEQGHRAGQDD